MKRTHELKTLPLYFQMVWLGRKPFEVRKDDRGFHAGDMLALREWHPEQGYSGREIHVPISYVLKDDGFAPMPVPLPEGVAVLGLAMVERELLHVPPRPPLRLAAGDKEGAP